MGTVCSHSEKDATAKLEPIQYTARDDFFRATGSLAEEKFGITRPGEFLKRVVVSSTNSQSVGREGCGSLVSNRPSVLQ